MYYELPEELVKSVECRYGKSLKLISFDKWNSNKPLLQVCRSIAHFVEHPKLMLTLKGNLVGINYIKVTRCFYMVPGFIKIKKNCKRKLFSWNNGNISA